MAKVRPQLDSARQTGLETTLTDFLIVVEAWFTGGWNGLGGILKVGNLDAFLPTMPHNQEGYGKLDATAWFSASERSRNQLDEGF